MEYEVIRLNTCDIDRFHALNDLFGEAFEDVEGYTKSRPSSEYLKSLLSTNYCIALIVVAGEELVGGLVAYELKKFEQMRSEIYIYDLAVSGSHRRKGLATMLIRQLQNIASEMGAWVIFVQADYVDKPAVALYSKLGEKEDVLHFDIPVIKNSTST